MQLVNQPFVLARSCSEPDAEFATLASLAREILKIRDATEGRPGLVVTPGTLARGELRGGAMLAVRMDDGTCNDRGTLIGYAMLPAQYGDKGAKALMAAILAPGFKAAA